MSNLITVCIAVVLYFSCSASPGRADQPPEGDWVGALNLKGTMEVANVHFKNEEGGVHASLDFPVRQQMDLALSRVMIEAGKIHFEWEDQSGPVIFDGQLSGNTISGTTRQGEARGSFELVRTVKIDAATYAEYGGLYEITPGKLVAIGAFPGDPQYVDFESGRTGSLFALSESTLFAGPAYQIPAPIDIRITFVRGENQEVTGLVWQQSGSPEKLARKIKFRREDLTFRNGDVTLSGTLVLPNTAGPHPAVVRIHGAGPATRLNFIDEYNAYHGIAFFSYDKRGAGKSTGDWREAGVEELAGDALAAVQTLKARKDINAKQVGVAGGSEGGWVAPLVAARDRSVAFIITISGPALSFSEEVLYEIEDGLRANGLSEDEVKRALAFRRRISELTRSGDALTDEGWAKVEAATREVRNEKWFPFISPWPKGFWRWKKFHMMSKFDPQPLWEKTTIPVLAFYGERDRNVPATRNAAALEQYLRKAGNKDFTVITLPKANHYGMEAERGFLDGELSRLTRTAPGFLDGPLKWTLKHVDVKK